MTVTILEGDKGKVDFRNPVEMSDKQYDDFIDMLESLFAEEAVQESEIEENRSDRLGDKHFAREWTPSELQLLYKLEDTKAISNKLGRSWMSVDIKRGGFLPPFLDWVEDNDYNLMRDNIQNLIEEYMQEKELRKEKRKNLRKEIRNLEEEIEGNESQIERLEEMIEAGQPQEREKRAKEIIEGLEEEIKELKDKIETKEDRLEELQG